MNKPHWTRCPRCRVYFRPWVMVIIKVDKKKFRNYICPQCGKEYAAGFHKGKGGSYNGRLERRFE